MFARKFLNLNLNTAEGKRLVDFSQELRNSVRLIGYGCTFKAEYADVSFWGKHLSKNRQKLYPFSFRFFNGIENVLLTGKSTEENLIKEIKICVF